MYEVNEYQGMIRMPRMIIIDTRPTRVPVYSRGYSLTTTHEDLRRLNYAMCNEDSNLGRISELDIIQAVPNVMNLEAIPFRVDIANGWDTKRARFLLEAESTMSNIIFKTYIQGYTDYIDNSLRSNLLDPNMRFIINSMVIVTLTRNYATGEWFANKQDYYNVIPGGIGMGGAYEQLGDQGERIRLIRPEDVMNSLLLVDKYEQSGITTINTTDLINKTAVSKRSNNDIIGYFKDTTNAFIDAKNLASMPDDREAIYREARKVNSVDIMKNPFLMALSNVTGAILPNEFKMGDLELLDPGIRPTYMNRMEDPIVDTAMFMQTEDTASTLQATAESIKATIVANTISSYMSEEMVTSFCASMTNMGGENAVIVTNINSFIDHVDTRSHTNRMLTKIKTLLMNKISDGGITPFEIYITADLLNEITVGVSLYGAPPIVFRFPSYADSLYTPVVTTAQNKDLLVNDFQNVLDQTYRVNIPQHNNIGGNFESNRFL